MKKIILTVVTTLFVAGAAQAQSPRVEVMMISPAFNGTGAKQSRPQANVQQQQNQVLRVVMQQVAKAKQKAQHANAADPAKRSAKPAAKTQEGGVGQWLKAIFLGGRFPGESTQDYHDRMVAQTQPAALPFK